MVDTLAFIVCFGIAAMIAWRNHCARQRLIDDMMKVDWLPWRCARMDQPNKTTANWPIPKDMVAEIANGLRNELDEFKAPTRTWLEQTGLPALEKISGQAETGSSRR